LPKKHSTSTRQRNPILQPLNVHFLPALHKHGESVAVKELRRSRRDLKVNM